MNHIIPTLLAGAAFASMTSASASVLADSRPFLSSPFDGAWFNKNDGLDFAGETSEPGTIEFQMLDHNTGEWVRAGEITTDQDGYTNDQGELRYRFAITSSINCIGHEERC